MLIRAKTCVGSYSNRFAYNKVMLLKSAISQYIFFHFPPKKYCTKNSPNKYRFFFRVNKAFILKIVGTK